MGDDVDEVSTELRRAVTRLYSRFRSERVEGEVPDASLFVLIALDKNPGLSLTELAEAAHVTLGSMSQSVRRLEAQAYVTKTRGSRDRRRVVFTLTPRGRAAADASRRHRHDWLRGRVAQLTPEQRADIARVAPLLLDIADS